MSSKSDVPNKPLFDPNGTYLVGGKEVSYQEMVATLGPHSQQHLKRLEVMEAGHPLGCCCIFVALFILSVIVQAANGAVLVYHHIVH